MDSIVQTKMEETLDSAEEAIEQLQEELHVTKKQTKKLERYVEDRRGKFIKLMLNAPLSRAFRTWRGSHQRRPHLRMLMKTKVHV